MWLGFIANKTCTFRLPDSYTRWDEKATAKANDGHHYGNVPSITTFTNLDISKRHEDLILFRRYYEDPSLYPKYDNYDAINVDKVKYIPEDYDGIVGVPITFLCDYNPEQFEILGSRRWGKSEDLINAHISHDRETAMNDKKTLINGKETYDRIFIRNLHPLTSKSSNWHSKNRKKNVHRQLMLNR